MLRAIGADVVGMSHRARGDRRACTAACACSGSRSSRTSAFPTRSSRRAWRRSSPSRGRAEPNADRARARRAGATVTVSDVDARDSACCRRTSRRTSSSRSCSRGGARRTCSRARCDARAGAPPFVFFEGPPTANGKPGHPSRVRAHDQGPLLPPSRDEGLSRAAQGGVGHARPAGRDRGREAAAASAASRTSRSSRRRASSTGCAARAC